VLLQVSFRPNDAMTISTSLHEAKKEEKPMTPSGMTAEPDWELAPNQKTTGLSHIPVGYSNGQQQSIGNSRRSFRQRFDTWLPPYKRYCGMRRRSCLIVSILVLLALLALIIGLAVGLSKKKSNEYVLCCCKL
jgi:hypothetical protein